MDQATGYSHPDTFSYVQEDEERIFGDLAALSIFSMVGGPLLGLFSLGMFLPFCNPLGAIVGLLVGFSMSLWAGIGAQIYPPLPERSRPLPLSTVGCDFSDTVNVTSVTEMTLTTFVTVAQAETIERPLLADYWYSLSYLYFSILGTLVVFIVGAVVSLLSGGWKQNINIDYLYGRQDCALVDMFRCFKTNKKENIEVLEWKSHPSEGHDNPTFSQDDISLSQVK